MRLRYKFCRSKDRWYNGASSYLRDEAFLYSEGIMTAEILKKYINRENFTSYKDFKENFDIIVPDNFCFAFDVVDEWARIEPNKKALLYVDDHGFEKEFTFAEISLLSKKAASFFLSKGIKKGDRVITFLRRRWEYWVTVVALSRIGAILIPSSVQMTKKDIVYRVNSAKVKFIVAFADEYAINQIESAMPSLESVVGFAITGSNEEREGWLDYQKAIFESEPYEGERVTENDDIFMIYFTSGTTGMPKMVAHRQIYPLGHITTAKFWHQVEENTMHLTVSDSGWAKFGWGCIYGQWICGAEILGYDMDRFNPQNLVNILHKYKPATFCVPPTIYRFLLKNGITAEDFASIKHCSTAGEPLPPEVSSEFKRITGKTIFEGFGQTESSVMLGTYEWFDAKPGSMGKPSPLYDIDVIDADGNRLGIGETGELAVLGMDKRIPPGLFVGYWSEDGIKNTFSDGIYHLGDMAWKDEEGYFWFVGRNDDMIKCSGYRIGPFEIESILLTHPAVLECAITGAPDEIRGQVVKASIVLMKGYEGSEALIKELQNYVKSMTAPYKYPRIVEFVKELPKTTTGKISRVSIRNNNNN